MNNIYLIYGSDYELIKREVHKLTNDKNDVVKYDLDVIKVDELLDDASTISLFEESKVLVGENALFLTTNKTNIDHNLEYLENYIDDNNHDNIVIFTCICDKLDERKKIVKLLKQKAKVIKKDVIDLKKLPNFVMSEFKNEGYDIDYKTANYFVNYVGNNVDIILSEINKMIIYKEKDKNISIKDINDISSKAFKDNVFDLLDGITKKDYKKVFDCYNDLKIVGEEPIKIIAMLGKKLIFILNVKQLSHKMNSDEISSYLKVHPYRVKLALECDFMEYELTDLIKKLHSLDYEIKSGKKDKMVAFEDFLVRL